MKLRTLLLLTFALVGFTLTAEAQALPRKVRNVEVQDLDAKKARLPWWGEKNLLIFYVDPEVPKQNHEFITYIEETGRVQGPNIEGFGIVNLKDAIYPNDVVRKIADARTAKNGATILCDPDHYISSAWRLGDCNNMFVIMLVNKAGELVYVHKGEMNEAEQQKFIEVADKLR
jgi:predicted transcriptional regulator